MNARGPRAGNFARIESNLVKRHHLSTPPSLAELGPLEQRVLEAVWSRGNGTVHEVIESATLGVAYTTVMTTLNRLYRKHLLGRDKEGRAFRYTPRFTREEMHRATAEQFVRDLLSTASSATLRLSYLVEAITEHDVRLLNELKQMIEQKRSSIPATVSPRIDLSADRCVTYLQQPLRPGRAYVPSQFRDFLPPRIVVQCGPSFRSKPLADLDAQHVAFLLGQDEEWSHQAPASRLDARSAFALRANCSDVRHRRPS